MSPYFDEGCFINFSGGEPLLEFDKIRSAVEFLDDLSASLHKNWQYSLTTNGSLLEDKIITFLSDHNFHITLSFDGYPQNTLREAETFDSIVKTIHSIQQHPNLTLETNTVCIPASVHDIAKSIKYISELGVPDILLSFSNMHPWTSYDLDQLKVQLGELRQFLSLPSKHFAKMPFKNFREIPDSGRFFCEGGKTRMALSQDGTLWGCYLFSDLVKQTESHDYRNIYSFGKVDDLPNSLNEQFRKILANYAILRGDRFFSDKTICSLCPDVEVCSICPATAAFSTGLIGQIPSWMCSLKRIVRKERGLFLNGIAAQKKA